MNNKCALCHKLHPQQLIIGKIAFYVMYLRQMPVSCKPTGSTLFKTQLYNFFFPFFLQSLPIFPSLYTLIAINFFFISFLSRSLILPPSPEFGLEMQEGAAEHCLRMLLTLTSCDPAHLHSPEAEAEAGITAHPSVGKASLGSAGAGTGAGAGEKEVGGATAMFDEDGGISEQGKIGYEREREKERVRSRDNGRKREKENK